MSQILKGKKKDSDILNQHLVEIFVYQLDIEIIIHAHTHMHMYIYKHTQKYMSG